LAWGITILVATDCNKEFMNRATLEGAALIRRHGYRLTLQRQLILEAIAQSGDHVTPEAVYRWVAARAPEVNRATVYRNLDFLCDRRLVVAAHIGRETVYELAGPEPHHHLICRECSVTATLPNAAVQGFFREIHQAHAFSVDMDHLTLFGLCADCRAQPERLSK
jgi:Fur family ferric uptake transcriptional regulator